MSEQCVEWPILDDDAMEVAFSELSKAGGVDSDRDFWNYICSWIKANTKLRSVDEVRAELSEKHFMEMKKENIEKIDLIAENKVLREALEDYAEVEEATKYYEVKLTKARNVAREALKKAGDVV